ncbi:bifunctional (p)ppGpp synthetase/guanosine-3',5'-bis(diphosphate) 3'-pyrophosphohydrolase [Phormidium tenue FACHB-886]|nr:bifunctional (p)ppGpp synthetase/guanosine-3',5'-bis(diphosphate) 3'-pyrophosphohydrolase [Phormidium tenue FACHB-886]
MNVAIPSLPTDIALPNWLQECIIDHRSPLACDENTPTPADATLVCQAFEFAYCLHKGQTRASGEPYIAHPVAVAGLLRDLGGGAAMIAAGFLHDIIEDTDVTADEIEKRFGAETRHLVEGVTKLSKFNFSSKTERQAENFRRMFLAMAQDIRVIVVKLADRLHNMRTLEHLPDDKRRRIALETREIFAPLANRLGIGRFKWELEDLAFKYLEPEAYRQMQELVTDKRTDREARLDRVAATLRHRLEQLGIKAHDINGRPKHLYGIYHKMQRQQKQFQEIFDIAAVRVIVETVDECYRALAVVHDAFRPIPGRFKDYIGLPKPNRYQSLHTVVIGTKGRPIEVQIRTLEMHHVAEYGIAAHWKYKESGNSSSQMTSDDEKFTWLRQLLEWQSDLKDAQEYLESVKDNLFDDDVYVFTPSGDVVALNHGATPVDFAYRIHTEVGNHCAGARVNERIVTLDTPLKNGDIVEIITQKNAHPSLDWLNFAVTPAARNRIRQWYKRSNRDENLLRGRELLEKELGKSGLDALFKSEPMQIVAERCNYSSAEDLIAALGYGEITLNLVVNRIREAVKAKQPIAAAQTLEEDAEALLLPSHASTSTPPATQNKNCPIAGVEGLLYSLAGCCNPVPGESIIGVVTLGSRGISIHRQGCHNTDNIPGDRLIPVSWNHNGQNRSRPQTYPVQIQIEVIDRVGVLKDILSRLSDYNINVRSAQVKTFPGQTATISLGIDIVDHDQLERTFTQIRKMSDIIKLRRVSQVEQGDEKN